MATDYSPASEHEPRLELSIDELLKRARPLPEHQEMMIEDLSPEEAQAFLAAVRS